MSHMQSLPLEVRCLIYGSTLLGPVTQLKPIRGLPHSPRATNSATTQFAPGSRLPDTLVPRDPATTIDVAALLTLLDLHPDVRDEVIAMPIWKRKHALYFSTPGTLHKLLYKHHWTHTVATVGASLLCSNTVALALQNFKEFRLERILESITQQFVHAVNIEVHLRSQSPDSYTDLVHRLIWSPALRTLCPKSLTVRDLDLEAGCGVYALFLGLSAYSERAQAALSEANEALGIYTGFRAAASRLESWQGTDYEQLILELVGTHVDRMEYALNIWRRDALI